MVRTFLIFAIHIASINIFFVYMKSAQFDVSSKIVDQHYDNQRYTPVGLHLKNKNILSDVTTATTLATISTKRRVIRPRITIGCDQKKEKGKEVRPVGSATRRNKALYLLPLREVQISDPSKSRSKRSCLPSAPSTTTIVQQDINIPSIAINKVNEDIDIHETHMIPDSLDLLQSSQSHQNEVMFIRPSLISRYCSNVNRSFSTFNDAYANKSTSKSSIITKAGLMSLFP